MGYLFYADALGIQALTQKSPKLAEAALDAIHTKASEALSVHLPESNKRPVDDPHHSLVIFNDSIFFYCTNLQPTAHYASQLAHKLFVLPATQGGPLAIRGTIIETTTHPSIINKQGSSGQNVQASRLLVSNIGSALVAEKKKILGARIIISKRLLDDANFDSWDYRLQARTMHLAGMPERFGSDLLMVDRELRDYCDIAWMNVPSNEAFKGIYDGIQNFAYLAAFNQRASLHAAATLAMYRATENRRRGLTVILKQLWAGVAKAKELEKHPVEKDDYEGWLKLANTIKKHNGKLFFPIDMTEGRPPSR